MKKAILLIFIFNLLRYIALPFDPGILYFALSLLLLCSQYYLYGNDRRFGSAFYSNLLLFVLQSAGFWYELHSFYPGHISPYGIALVLLNIVALYLYLHALNSHLNKLWMRIIICVSFLYPVLTSSFTLPVYLLHEVLFYVYSHQATKQYPPSGKRVSFVWTAPVITIWTVLFSISYFMPLWTYTPLPHDPTQSLAKLPSYQGDSQTLPYLPKNCMAYQTSPTEVTLVTTLTPHHAPFFCREMEFQVQCSSRHSIVQTSLQGYFLQNGKWYRTPPFQRVIAPHATSSATKGMMEAIHPDLKEALLLPPPRTVSKYVLIATYSSPQEPIEFMEEYLLSRCILNPYKSQYLSQSPFFNTVLFHEQ